MGRSWLLSLLACLALQAVLWWSLCSSQVPGFISIDCGSDVLSVYKDDNGIEWVGDSNLTTEGTPTAVTGNDLRVLSTLRLFEGNHNKYCYNLYNSAIKRGSIYLVRASFWPGSTLPYTPQNPDGKFRFKIIVNADLCDDIAIPSGTTSWYYSESYIRAQGSSIDVCFARSRFGGDPPFVSTLEVRPLPITLTSTRALLDSNRFFRIVRRYDYIVSSTSSSYNSVRYPLDPLDRLWYPEYVVSSATFVNNTTATISTENQEDELPAKILQNAYVNTTITISFTSMDPTITYFVELFFAEIDRAVKASSQRVFNILANGTTSGPIDIFDAVGADAAYGYGINAIPDEEGDLVIQLSATTTSIYPSLIAAAEFFYTQFSNTVTDANTVIGKLVIPKGSVREFSFQEIKVATNNFGTQLGVGGFGPVYRGRLQDGRFVAIKVASNFSHQGSKEFLNEVDLLSRVHHKNLVELLGYCNDGKLVLVYEFMSQGSLFDCLHGPYAKASPLSWRERLRILVDAAQGFDYLHNGCKPRIIHRDVKTSNVLLNDDLEAKISDFGISRNSSMNESRAPPTAVMGSLGYLDPEYLSSLRLTERVDVYSFGVVLFEVVSGKTAVFPGSSEQQTHVVEWARPLIDCGMIENIVDPSLHQEYNVSSMWKVLDIALACVSAQRPRMSAVFLELKDAERMELESDQRNVVDKPSAEFIARSDSTSLSLTHVNTR